MMKMLLLPVILFLSSCVAVWGGGYHVDLVNSEGMLVQFDPWMVSSGTLAKVASDEASKFGKVPVPGEHEPAHYPGIQQRYFKFVKPSL
jgi:hypothetical protein